MLDLTAFGMFFAAAFILAVVPGPGMLYVLARTLRGGRREGRSPHWVRPLPGC